MDYRPFTPEEAVAAASAALSRSWGASVVIDTPRNLGEEGRRNLILRASATTDGRDPRSIIIKATRAASYEARAANAYAVSGFVREWTAASYIARRALRPSFAPILLAYDLDQGVLVYEDLGESVPSLVGPLLRGTAREAEQALTSYAEALAALHRATTECRSGHSAALREGFPSSEVPPPAHRWIEDVARVSHSLLGGAFPEDEADIVAERLKQPGCWQALIHGDPCPDNVLLRADGRAVLIDFEFARPGHALFDAAFWRMGFPTCWCAGTVPADVVQRLESTYRVAVADAVPEAADDDTFTRESAIIDVAWLLENLAWLLEDALAEDGVWGCATNRSRILSYLDRAIRSTGEAEILKRFRALAVSWQDDLRSRWPDVTPLSDYPAFARVGDEPSGR